jgi:hypothetical protein
MSAILDETRTYRYRLYRGALDLNISPVLWIGLNPSTADETVNDPTVRKVLGFQVQWSKHIRSYTRGTTELVNLFALRATDPRKLARHPDPVGPDNDEHIRRAADEVVAGKGTIVVAWGANAFARKRAMHVAGLLWPFELMCLGTTKDGSPRHPLYVPYSQPLVPWKGYNP